MRELYSNFNDSKDKLLRTLYKMGMYFDTFLTTYSLYEHPTTDFHR